MKFYKKFIKLYFRRTTKNMSSLIEITLDIAEEVYARIQNDFGNVSEEEFNDKLYDIVHEELDNDVNIMWNSEVDRLMVEIGFDKAMKTYIDEYGAIESGITSKTLLYVCIHNELNEQLSYEEFVAWANVEESE